MTSVISSTGNVARRCNKQISLRDGSFFSKSKLSLQNGPSSRTGGLDIIL